MEVVYTLSDSQIRELHALYQKEWWCAGRSLEDTYKVVAGTTLNIGLIDNGRLVGYARVLTDTVFKAFIFDVIIAEGYRQKGLGDLILNTILTHERIVGVNHVELYCKETLVPYYEKYGFVTDVGPIKLMRRDKK